jgi:hypothetical protein
MYHASWRQILELFNLIIDPVTYKGNCLQSHQAGFPLKDVGPYLRDGCRDNLYGDWFWSTGVLFPAVMVTDFFTLSPISSLGPTIPYCNV